MLETTINGCACGDEGPGPCSCHTCPWPHQPCLCPSGTTLTRARNKRHMHNARCLGQAITWAVALVTAPLAALASSGDRQPAFQGCVQHCQRTGCAPWFTHGGNECHQGTHSSSGPTSCAQHLWPLHDFACMIHAPLALQQALPGRQPSPRCHGMHLPPHVAPICTPCCTHLHPILHHIAPTCSHVAQTCCHPGHTAGNRHALQAATQATRCLCLVLAVSCTCSPCMWA